MTQSISQDPEETARRRAEAIMKVRCGVWTARQAAAALGVSRKTYYQWEERGLSALLTGLSDQPAGRPRQAACDRESLLEAELNSLRRENDLLQQRIRLKDLVWNLNDRPGSTDRGEKK
jgi:hypothetical protein